MIGSFVENLPVWCPNDSFIGTHDHIVIPAFAGIQPGKPGFRIKSGIRLRRTVKRLLRHYTIFSAHAEPVEPRAAPWPFDTLRGCEEIRHRERRAVAAQLSLRGSAKQSGAEGSCSPPHQIATLGDSLATTIFSQPLRVSEMLSTEP
jgi:hypothetical protein